MGRIKNYGITTTNKKAQLEYEWAKAVADPNALRNEQEGTLHSAHGQTQPDDAQGDERNDGESYGERKRDRLLNFVLPCRRRRNSKDSTTSGENTRRDSNSTLRTLGSGFSAEITHRQLRRLLAARPGYYVA
ncbi:hypothetical protein T439DRAFT_360443 [Meredithblackwellia eburnea MCA 4105]